MIDRRKFLKKAILFIPAAGLFRHFVKEGHAKPATEGYDPANHLYGMGIDIDKCIGCGRCVEACKTENNVPKEPFFTRTWVEGTRLRKMAAWKSRTLNREKARWEINRQKRMS